MMKYSSKKSGTPVKRPRVRIGFAASPSSHVVANIDTACLENHVPLLGWPSPQWGESPIMYAARVRSSKVPLPHGASRLIASPRRNLADLAAWVVLSGQARSPQTEAATVLMQERLAALSEAWRATRGITPWSPETGWVSEAQHPLLAELSEILQIVGDDQLDQTMAAWIAGDSRTSGSNVTDQLIDTLLSYGLNPSGDPDDGESPDGDDTPPVNLRKKLGAAAALLRLIPAEKEDEVRGILRDLWTPEAGAELPEPRISGIVAITQEAESDPQDRCATSAFGTRPIVYVAPNPVVASRNRGTVLLHPGLAASVQLRGKPRPLDEILLALRAELQLKEDPGTGTSWSIEANHDGDHYYGLRRWSEKPDGEDEQDVRDRWIVAYLNDILHVPALSGADRIILDAPARKAGDEVGEAVGELLATAAGVESAGT